MQGDVILWFDRRGRKAENVGPVDMTLHCRTCLRLIVTTTGLTVLVLLAQAQSVEDSTDVDSRLVSSLACTSGADPVHGACGWARLIPAVACPADRAPLGLRTGHRQNPVCDTTDTEATSACAIRTHRLSLEGVR